MRRSRSSVRFFLAASIFCVCQISCRSAPAPPPRSQLTNWAEGPVRWLLLPAEWRQIRRVGSPAEASAFVERFWRRRDPAPLEPGNPFRQQFFERVEAADLLYGEGETKGSLTDRGRALILLGSPSRLRISSEQALTWNPRLDSRHKVTVRDLPLEVWGYRLKDLPRPLAQALAARLDGPEARISFIKEPGRAYLSEGEEILELAARTALAAPR